jgi:hypothetical protein
VETEDETRNTGDELERKQYQDFKLGNRRSPLSNNILNLLGDLLQPQTKGFDHINLDMSFTYQDSYGIMTVKNSSFLITYFQMWGFKKALYLERSNLATHLIAYRSLNGKSMEMFTNTVTKQVTEYQDKTPKASGFGRLFGGKPKEPGA